MTAIAPPMATVRNARTRPARRAAWTAFGLAFAAVLVVAIAGSLIGAAAYQSIPSTHRVFSIAIDAVHVDVDGAVTIESGHTRGAVVESSGARGLSAPSDVEGVTAGTLEVRSSCPLRFFENHCARNYNLRVPPDVTVVVDTDSGDVMADGMRGPLTLHSGQGDIVIDGAAGRVHVSSGQGDVSATGLNAPNAVAVSGQGDVRLEFRLAPRSVTATSGQGDVTIDLPRGAVAYQVHTSSGQGDVRNNVSENPASRRIVRANSGQGNVSVAYGKR
jgi:hypothetical protein